MKKGFKSKHRVGLAEKFIWKNPDELLGQPNIILEYFWGFFLTFLDNYLRRGPILLHLLEVFSCGKRLGEAPRVCFLHGNVLIVLM